MKVNVFNVNNERQIFSFLLSVFRILNNIILMNRTDKKILVHQEVECKAAVLFRYHWVALK